MANRALGCQFRYACQDGCGNEVLVEIPTNSYNSVDYVVEDNRPAGWAVVKAEAFIDDKYVSTEHLLCRNCLIRRGMVEAPKQQLPDTPPPAPLVVVKRPPMLGNDGGKGAPDPDAPHGRDAGGNPMPF